MITFADAASIGRQTGDQPCGVLYTEDIHTEHRRSQRPAWRSGGRRWRRRDRAMRASRTRSATSSCSSRSRRREPRA
jgi:hypothetical protein